MSALSRPERRAKILAALEREARRIGYRFLLLHLKTECVLAFLRVRLAMLMVRADLQRLLRQHYAKVAHHFPLWFRRKLARLTRESSACEAPRSGGADRRT
jgi:hypothetical protein